MGNIASYLPRATRSVWTLSFGLLVRIEFLEPVWPKAHPGHDLTIDVHEADDVRLSADFH